MSFDASAFSISILLIGLGVAYAFAAIVHPSQLPLLGSVDFTKRRNVLAVLLMGFGLIGCGVVVGLLGR